MNDNWAGSSAFIQAEDSSHQSTDVKRNNPFHLGFGPGFKCRHWGRELGFLGVPGSGAAHPQNPSTKTSHGLSPLSVFSLIPQQVCPRLSQVLPVSNPNPQTAVPLHPNQDSSWRQTLGVRVSCSTSVCPHTRPDISRRAVAWYRSQLGNTIIPQTQSAWEMRTSLSFTREKVGALLCSCFLSVAELGLLQLVSWKPGWDRSHPVKDIWADVVFLNT